VLYRVEQKQPYVEPRPWLFSFTVHHCGTADPNPCNIVYERRPLSVKTAWKSTRDRPGQTSSVGNHSNRVLCCCILLPYGTTLCCYRVQISTLPSSMHSPPAALITPPSHRRQRSWAALAWASRAPWGRAPRRGSASWAAPKGQGQAPGQGQGQGQGQAVAQAPGQGQVVAQAQAQAQAQGQAPGPGPEQAQAVAEAQAQAQGPGPERAQTQAQAVAQAQAQEPGPEQAQAQAQAEAQGQAQAPARGPALAQLANPVSRVSPGYPGYSARGRGRQGSAVACVPEQRKTASGKGHGQTKVMVMQHIILQHPA
jgi:hypothetical protein